MRINRLTMQGFGPYKTAQHVDFDAFADDGIFLMGGKTGAGKSSILDAICFALYDGVPRYDGTKGRLRSDHCGPDDPSLVTLEFTAGDTRYRVERAPEYERQKARGLGTVTQKPTAELFELQGGEWVGIEAGPRTVGPRVAELVGLNRDQFLQVILLAQNRFQQFLLAKSEARQDVLRSLFGTRRFQDYELAITEQRKALDGEIGSQRTTLAQMLEQAVTIARSLGLDAEGDAANGTLTAGSADEKPAPDAADDSTAAIESPARVAADLVRIPEPPVPEQVTAWLADLRGAAKAQLSTAARDADAADTAFTLADDAHDDLVAQRTAQLRRADAEQRLDALRAASAAVDADRAALAAAGRADVAIGAVMVARRAQAAAEHAAAALASAQSAFAASAAARAATDDGDGDAVDAPAGTPNAAEIDAVIERTTLQRGALEEALHLEREMPAQIAEVERLRNAHETAETALAEALEHTAALPALIAADSARLTELMASAATLEATTAERGRLMTALEQAENAVTLATRLTAAREIELTSGQESTAASAELDRLRTARLNGHAAELATALRDGDPCAVCGATEHPTPAQVSVDAVTEVDIEAAEALLSERRERAEAARLAAGTLAEKLAAATASAGGRTVVELAKLIEVATAARDTAAAAESEAERLSTRLAGRRTEHESAEALVGSLREALGLAATAMTTARTRRESAEQRLASQRASHATVAERSAALAEALRVARGLADAIAGDTSAASAVRDADAALTGQLHAQGFDSAEAVAAAHLDGHERAGIESRVRTHDDAVAAATATLGEPELAELPAELVELDASASVLAAARDARDAALARHATVHGQAAALDELIARAGRLLAASAELIERYEVVARLAATLKGDAPNERRMRLESFVLAAELEEIVAAANARLRQMSGGRYTLEHDDGIAHRGAQSGLGLAILDGHTGQQRATHSLSGGETFLASLALALGLAEVVTGRAGGITLDTLFIDEGFGSLDADTLEIAMATLDSLRTGGRTIGLISHVEAMKEQIHASLQVSVGEHGWSTITQAAA
jgi:exonuclease SbcC